MGSVRNMYVGLELFGSIVFTRIYMGKMQSCHWAVCAEIVRATNTIGHKFKIVKYQMRLTRLNNTMFVKMYKQTNAWSPSRITRALKVIRVSTHFVQRNSLLFPGQNSVFPGQLKILIYSEQGYTPCSIRTQIQFLKDYFKYFKHFKIIMQTRTF